MSSAICFNLDQILSSGNELSETYGRINKFGKRMFLKVIPPTINHNDDLSDGY